LRNSGRHIIVTGCIVVCMALSFFSVTAQDKKTQLEAKRKKLEEEIKFTQKLLQKTKANKDATMADLNALNEQIKLRQTLIEEVGVEINAYSAKINENVEHLKTEEQQLTQLKSEYADAIVKTYKYQRFADKLMFVLNAESFAQAWRRINYLRKYAEYRNQQVAQIVDQKSAITGQIAQINDKKKTKEQLLQGKVQEANQLNKTVVQKNQVVQSLKKQETLLTSEIQKKKAAQQKLDAQIEIIIKKEIEAARLAEEKRKKEEAAKAAAELAKKKAAEEAIKKAKSEGKKVTKEMEDAANKNVETPAKITTTPEYDLLTTSFASNRGKLPWPVEKGFISKGFGRYNHPDLDNVSFENNGVDIRTDANTNVRCVFEGKVVGILNNPTFKNAVIVSHGDYFTVYSKLASVNVSKGQKVSTKQVIGMAYTDEQSITEVHLEVWKGAAKLNPADWIYRK